MTKHSKKEFVKGHHWSPYGLPREMIYSTTDMGSLQTYQNDVCIYDWKSLGEGIELSKEYP
jgi:hypothetical protein